MTDYLDKIEWQNPEFAEFYDELPLWSAPFGRMLLERVPLGREKTLLDVGAGTGFLTVELAQRCGATTTVIAVDPWEGAIQRLQRKIHQFGLGNVRPVVQDAALLDLPSGSVDLIVSNLGINNFERPEAVLQACFRVAKPGASMFLTTNLVGHMAEFYDVYRAVLIESGWTDRLSALDAHISHRATPDSVRGRLTRTGFEMVKVETSSFHERFVDGSSMLRHYRIRSGFIEAWKSVAFPYSAQAFFGVLEQRLNDLAARQGELALTIPIACFEARKPAAAVC